MAGETTLVVVGNLTADPELRYTQNGLAVANFTVASTPRSFNRQTNEFEDGEALFMRCSVWREVAENVAASLTKGSRVIVSGFLKQREYETREGEKRTAIELDVQEVGPSLKYATAQLTRVVNGKSAGKSNAPVGQPGRPAEPAATTHGYDAWATPGAYGDDTPF